MVNFDGLYNKNYFGDKLKIGNYLSRKELYVEVIEDGVILPHLNYISPETPSGLGGIIDSEGNFIAESYLNALQKFIYKHQKDIAYKDETVIYFGMLVNIWGHCLTDNIKRLWFFLNDTYKKYFKNCRIVYLPMWSGIIPSFAKLLEVVGFNVNNLHAINEPTRFKEIILPDVSFFAIPDEGGRRYTIEYDETIERIRYYAQKNFSPLPNKKFYFFHNRNQFGEGYLANYFYSKGYEIIYPFHYPFEEQLNILANCESFASNVGSIAHNTLFVKDGTECIFVPRTCNGALNEYQNLINQLRNLNASYVDSSLSIFRKDDNGPYCYIVSENLRKHFNDDVSEKFSFEDFIQFIIYSENANSEGLNVNQEEIKYLEKTFAEFVKQFDLQT